MQSNNQNNGNCANREDWEPDGPLYPLHTERDRIAAAKDAATRRRVEAGLPAEPDDGPFSEEWRRARWTGRKAPKKR